MYEIVWSEESLVDFERVHVRHQRMIRDGAEDLRSDPLAPPTVHRRPLEEPPDELGAETWQLRLGDFRLFYSADPQTQTITILRVILKGRWTTVEALRRSRQP